MTSVYRSQRARGPRLYRYRWRSFWLLVLLGMASAMLIYGLVRLAAP